MYFTLMFADAAEGPSRTYDLAFLPSPVWMRGEKTLVTPDPSSPHYKLGYLKLLMEHEDLESIRFLSSSVTVSVHYNGHGTDEDLEALLEDLRNENYDPVLWNPESGSIYTSKSD